MSNLRFDGSVWCNLDIALRNLDPIYAQAAQPLGLTVLECYILQVLFEQDSQHATDLAHAIGRAPTSFTPILDKLENKGFVRRQPDPQDRRAIYIHLTDDARALQNKIHTNLSQIDTRLQALVANGDWDAFERIIAGLQSAAIEGKEQEAKS